jgi:sec-independent protein translocase protein TatB
MFDFGLGYTEIFVIAVVAIIVIGPKDLPRVLRALGKTVAKMRGMAREFQGHLDSAMKETGFDEVKKEFDNLKSSANVIEPVKKTVVSEAKKQEDDFKKMFGEVPAADAPRPEASPPAPAVAAAPAAEPANPAAAS